MLTTTMAVPTVGVGAIIFNGQRQVLLVRRGQAPAQGLWSVPGGRQEAGESLAEACVREVMEETGLATEVTGVVAVVERLQEGFHYVIVDFLARLADQHSDAPTAGGDAEAVRWVGLEGLAAYALVPGLAAIIGQAWGCQQAGGGLLARDGASADFVARAPAAGRQYRSDAPLI